MEVVKIFPKPVLFFTTSSGVRLLLSHVVQLSPVREPQFGFCSFHKRRATLRLASSLQELEMQRLPGTFLWTNSLPRRREVRALPEMLPYGFKSLVREAF